MLTIRLQRVGRRNQAAFRIVLAEKHRHVKKKAVEILGHYNPRTKEFGIKDEEKLKYWIGQHVEVSPTVHNLFIEKGLVTGDKVKSWRPKIKKAVEEATAEGGAPQDAGEKAETPAEGGATPPVEETKASSETSDKEVKTEEKTEAGANGEAPQDAVAEPKAKEDSKDVKVGQKMETTAKGGVSQDAGEKPE